MDGLNMKALIRAGIGKVMKQQKVFWPLTGILTALMSIWLFHSSGGITGLAREAMGLSLSVYGEQLYLFSMKFFLKISAPFFLMMLSLFCWWMVLRNWASYYLNRKLILSYLFFALIPMLSTIGIFILGARTIFGLTAAHGVEKGMQTFSKAMENYTYEVQEKLVTLMEQGSSITREAPKKIEHILSENPLRDITGNIFPGFSVHIFYRTDRPGQAWLCLNAGKNSPANSLFYPTFIPPQSPLFSGIHPVWLAGDHFSGITKVKNHLYFKSYRFYQKDQSQFVVQTSLPIDSFFLNKLQERLSVNLTLEGLNEPWQIMPKRRESLWYIRLFLRPLRSHWMVDILDWEQGNSQVEAQMVFDVAPHLFGTDSGDHSLDIFLGSNQMRIQFLFIIIVIGILVIAQTFALIFGFILVGYITKSLDILATGNDIVAQGQLSYRLPRLGNDQLGSMASSFNDMVANIQNLIEQSKEKEKLQEELRIAREIQISLLPSMEGQALGSYLDAVCIPAREVGGDYFEILEPEDGSTGILVADVSGKGTSAAFYMAEMKGILLALKPLWHQPVELIVELNSILHSALKANIFISAIYSLINPEKKRVEIVRAGHCPAILVHLDGEPELIQPRGMALGLTRSNRFKQVIQSQFVTMLPREKLILFTDGLDEMMSGHEMYGIQRLLNICSEKRTVNSQQMKDAILKDVKDFIQSGEQSDDLTLIVVEMPE